MVKAMKVKVGNPLRKLVLLKLADMQVMSVLQVAQERST